MLLNRRCSLPVFPLEIYYQNVRGVRTKLRLLTCNALLCSYDVVVFTETWLTSDFYDNELGFSNFELYRCDRDSIKSQCSRGGGGVNCG